MMRSSSTTGVGCSHAAGFSRSRFRKIPQPPPGFDDMSGEVWYPVGPHDVFPEEFATFLLTNRQVREIFVAHHGELLDAAWWQEIQRGIDSGEVAEVLSYPSDARLPPPAAGDA